MAITDGLRKWHVISELDEAASQRPGRALAHVARVTSLPQVPAIIEQDDRLKELLSWQETRTLRQLDETNANIARLEEEREGLNGSDRARLTRRINVLAGQKETIGKRLGFREEPLELLSKVQGYRRFSVNGSLIIGQTHLIVMEGWILGRYEIWVDVERREHPYAARLARLGHEDEYYWHPHVISPDIICWGTYSPMLRRMEENGDIPSIFALVIQYLGSWASYDCYCQLPNMEVYRGPA